VNLATVGYLLWFPNDARVEALVYALADGPVAGALVAWQCPWLFGSAEHTVRCVVLLTHHASSRFCICNKSLLAQHPVPGRKASVIQPQHVLQATCNEQLPADGADMLVPFVFVALLHCPAC
jgi:hypothetical protein